MRDCKVLDRTGREVRFGFDGRLFVVPFKHRDARRTIYEGPYGPGVIQFFVIHDESKPVGNHSHRLTEEKFTIIVGGGYVVTTQVNADGQPIGIDGNIIDESEAVRSEQKLGPGACVTMMPGTAHAFYLVPETEMVCVASLPYMPEDVVPTPWLTEFFDH